MTVAERKIQKITETLERLKALDAELFAITGDDFPVRYELLDFAVADMRGDLKDPVKSAAVHGRCEFNANAKVFLTKMGFKGETLEELLEEFDSVKMGLINREKLAKLAEDTRRSMEEEERVLARIDGSEEQRYKVQLKYFLRQRQLFIDAFGEEAWAQFASTLDLHEPKAPARAPKPVSKNRDFHYASSTRRDSNDRRN